MQNEQNLLQPSMIGMKATCGECRSTGETSQESCSPRSPRSRTLLSPSRARSISVGMRSVARVPITMLTDEACSKTASPSSWATQPITPTSKISLVRSRGAHFTDARVNLSLCFFAHGTGVEQHHVRIIDRLAQIVSRGPQTRGCTLRISDIHLAAKSLYVNSRLHYFKPIDSGDSLPEII